MIKEQDIYDAGMEIMSSAAIDIPEDYRQGLRGMLDEEEEELDMKSSGD